LCLVGVGKKRGFIDRIGEWAIEPVYDYASPFSQGLAPVSMNGRWGFIDKSGKVVIKMKRGHNGRSFHDGLAGVRKNDQWGFIDQTGRWAIKPCYRKIDRFSFGVCSVKV
jgi:hypothetical protein